MVVVSFASSIKYITDHRGYLFTHSYTLTQGLPLHRQQRNEKAGERGGEVRQTQPQRSVHSPGGFMSNQLWIDYNLKHSDQGKGRDHGARFIGLGDRCAYLFLPDGRPGNFFPGSFFADLNHSFGQEMGLGLMVVGKSGETFYANLWLPGRYYIQTFTIIKWLWFIVIIIIVVTIILLLISLIFIIITTILISASEQFLPGSAFFILMPPAWPSSLQSWQWKGSLRWENSWKLLEPIQIAFFESLPPLY